ncbi:MAG: hypothetical protein ABIH66_13880 [bacterium]
MALISAVGSAGHINISALDVADAVRNSRPPDNAADVSQTARALANGSADSMGDVADVAGSGATALGISGFLDLYA